jgi:hypothetical protein
MLQFKVLMINRVKHFMLKKYLIDQLVIRKLKMKILINNKILKIMLIKNHSIFKF